MRRSTAIVLMVLTLGIVPAIAAALSVRMSVEPTPVPVAAPSPQSAPLKAVQAQEVMLTLGDPVRFGDPSCGAEVVVSKVQQVHAEEVDRGEAVAKITDYDSEIGHNGVLVGVKVSVTNIGSDCVMASSGGGVVAYSAYGHEMEPTGGLWAGQGITEADMGPEEYRLHPGQVATRWVVSEYPQMPVEVALDLSVWADPGDAQDSAIAVWSVR